MKTQTSRVGQVPLKTRGKKTGIIIRSEKGQTTLAILAELGLVDHSFKIKQSDTRLKIPLSRRPSKDDLESIEDRIGDFSVAIDDFEPHSKKPDSLEDALSLLPPAAVADVPRAFDIVGDLAIVELTPNLEPFQNIIANALMEVHKNVKAVYGKAGPVAGEERVRPLKHLAGDNRTSTVHREFGCMFKVDIAKVFFSPRLSQEHKRVAELVQPEEHVMDMFAGVGPYSVLIARNKARVTVDAVDINPDAVGLLKENVKVNHVDEKVRVWGGNVRDIVPTRDLLGSASRVIMNHPSQAKLFVDTAAQALRPTGGIVHYYTFAEGTEAEHFAVGELEDNLERVDWNIEQTLLVKKVRGISPLAWQVVVDAEVGPA